MALAVGFAAGMLAHEVIMEKLFRLPEIPTSLVFWAGIAELGCCALVSTIIEALSREPKPVLDLPNDAESAVPPVTVKVDGIFTAAGAKARLQSWLPYVAVSTLIFLGTTASTQSARYVNYTVKVVFKCSKLLPTMVSASFMGNSKKFSGVEYVAAVLLCVGTGVFSHSNSGKGTGQSIAAPHLLFGVICLLISVCMDALSPNVQQVLMRDGACPNLLMRRTNTLGAVLAAVGVVACGGSSELLTYSKKEPAVMSCLAGIGATLAFSICCQIRLIKEAGSVVTVGVSTLRKSCTMLLSYILFPGKEFSFMHAVGLAFVAAGLMMAEWKAIAAKLSKNSPGNKQPAVVDVNVLKANPYLRVESQVIGGRTSSIDDSSSDEGKRDQVLA